MGENFRNSSSLIPMWIGILAALFILNGENHMESLSKWTIIVSLLGIFMTGIVGLAQIFRDSSTLKSTKNDTGEIRPNVERIEKTTAKAKDILSETVIPSMAKINENAVKIDSIATSVAHFQWLMENSKTNTLRPEEMLAQISNVYEQKSKLEAKCEVLMIENKRLQERNEKLQADLHTERQKNHSQYDFDHDDYEMEL